ALAYIAGVIQKSLIPSEIVTISRIVIIDESNPELEILQRGFHVEHSTLEIKDTTLFGLSIKHAFILTSANRKQVA
ncbi:hypothetical protein, partial [Cellulophaga sp. BC115SP]|uniref:hypothetical protein n=1 Tax=Cellulophaga sp. BC115SP TaxID=2683263 RepID=UPI001411C5D5